MLAGTEVTGTIAQPLKAEEPLLMIVAKAVAVLPTWTERLDGNTAATSGPVPPVAPSDKRPIALAALSVNQIAPSGPTVICFGTKGRKDTP